jgi:alkanesulfonate monooxygenase SsuD/methylene tetrahydromethanopterin reductase-like flavin-dependent oxidoreductase (luciferase family)
VTHHGEFFNMDRARILPSPSPAIPIVIGGKGDAAINRAATYGDGWLGVFCSPRRFASTRDRILDAADAVLWPFIDAGAETLTITAAASSVEAGIEHAAEVRELLRSEA